MGKHVARALLLLTVATPAASQTRSGFVEGALLVDYDPTQRADADTKAGVSASAGVFITRRWSLRLEIDRPQWHGLHRTGESRVFDHIEAHDLQHDNRSPSWSLLVGRHYRVESRVSAAWVAGVTAASRDSQVNGWTERRDLQGNVTKHTDIAEDYGDYTWPALTAGADVTIALTKRMALVPQIRLHTYGGFSEHTSDTFIRPRVALRWQF
jgi:hypothetical protein